jgi:predicted permease
MFPDLKTRFRSLFRHTRVEDELDQELRFHFDQHVAKLEQFGAPRDEALRQARLTIGTPDSIKEECRDARGTRSLETLAQDLRYALRTLRKSPGFALVAILTIALGIGANTAVFSALHATLLRPLPYADAERIVMVWGVAPNGCCRHGGMVFSDANFIDVQSESRSFESIAAFESTGFTLSSVDSPENIRAAAVTADFFKVLRAEPLLGRTFLTEEQHSGRDHEVILSHALWRTRFGADPAIVGRTVRLDEVPYDVVGVMRADFQFAIPDYFGTKDAWVPYALTHDNARRGDNHLNVIARLAPGVSLVQAQAETNAVAQAIARSFYGKLAAPSATGPDATASNASPATEQHSGQLSGAKLEPLREEIFGDVTPVLWILFVCVAFVLLIACANVANLQLARGTSRQKEIALRSALGASRGRIVRQLLTESVVLATFGGALGALFAFWAVRASSAAGLAASLPAGTHLSIDAPVLLYTAVIAMAAGVLSGLASALHASPGGPGEALKESAMSVTAATRGVRLRAWLTVSEVALSAVLLIGAGLLVRSFIDLVNVDPGFSPRNVLTMQFTLPHYSYPDRQHQSEFYRQALASVEALPGVTSVGIVNDLPLAGDSDEDSFVIENRASQTANGRSGGTQDRMVSGDYFRAMKIPLVAGRAFTSADDASAQPVAIVSRGFARKYFAGEDPLGQRVTFSSNPAAGPWATIVGVVGDVHDLGLNRQPDVAIYTPYQQALLPYNPLSEMTLVAATAPAVGGPARIAPGALDAVRGIDHALPLPHTRPMVEVYASSIAARRLDMQFLLAFAGIAVGLAAIGIYGVIAYSVAQRTHEIGVRVAIGARPSDILGLVLGASARMVAIGMLIGLAGAALLTRFIAAMLFGVTPRDPLTFAAVAVLLAAVALVASYVPARRAMKVDPIIALRHE